jgi:outer membrane biosynthesis protein TonB
MRRAHVVTSLVLGAGLTLGPATAASASVAPDPTGIAVPIVTSTVSIVAAVVTPVLGVVGDKPPKDVHPGKTPKPKPPPKPHKHQPPPPPPPPPPPTPAPPPPPGPVPAPAPAPPPVAAAAPPATATPAGATVGLTSRAPTLVVPRTPAAVPAAHQTRADVSSTSDADAAAAAAVRVPIPGLADDPPAFDPTDIPAWGYGVALLLLVAAGFGAWALHLRGARW